MRIFILILGISLFHTGLNAQDFKIIVNESNSDSSLTEQEIARIFLKKVIKWEDGNKVFPVDFVVNNAIREAFSKKIHRKSIAAIKVYWQRQIFSGRSIPPLEKSSDKEVLEYVKSKPGAIGYVSSNFTVAGVNIIKIENK